MKIIDQEKLEKILTVNWANFLDYRRLIAFVLTCVRDNELPTCEETDLPRKNTEISVTRFSLKDNGFLLWIDFTVPKSNGFAIGTCECYLTNKGEINLNQIIGHVLTSQR